MLGCDFPKLFPYNVANPWQLPEFDRFGRHVTVHGPKPLPDKP